MNKLEIAKAIVGPHQPVPAGSKFTLEHLRDVRWNMLTDYEQDIRLAEAQAVIDLLS